MVRKLDKVIMKQYKYFILYLLLIVLAILGCFIHIQNIKDIFLMGFGIALGIVITLSIISQLK